MDSIFLRRSVRKFSSRKVEEEILEQILKAGMQAPSAANQRPWEFIIVEDPARRKELASVSPYASPAESAPMALVLVSNMEGLTFPQYWEQDMAACTENILLKCVDLELGAVWLGVAPEEDRISYIRELFDLPEQIIPFCIIPLGYPEEGKGNHFTDRYEKARVFKEEYCR